MFIRYSINSLDNFVVVDSDFIEDTFTNMYSGMLIHVSTLIDVYSGRNLDVAYNLFLYCKGYLLPNAFTKNGINNLKLLRDECESFKPYYNKVYYYYLRYDKQKAFW